MNLTLSDTQEHLLHEVDAFVREQMPLQRLHGDLSGERELLRTLGGLGWIGMGAPEGLGGGGFSLIDEALTCRALGRSLGPISFVAAAIAAQIAAAANMVCPPAILSGDAVVALACPAAPLEHLAGRVRLFANGVPDYAVLISPRGGVLVSPANGAALHEANSARVLPCLDQTVTMLDAEILPANVVVRGAGAALWPSALTLLAATSTGMAEGARDLIAAYAKVRHTFGRPIGAYQAVRHPIAEMAARCEQALTQTLFAALAIDSNRRDAETHAYAARILAQQAAAKNADGCIQLHGGIGVTDEYDAHFFMKRAHVIGLIAGGVRPLLDDILDQPLLGVSGA